MVSCSWHRAPAADVAFEILSFFARPPLGQQEGPAHTGREAAAPDCSLRIARLRRTDAGAYTVALRLPAVTTASVTLTVYGEPPRSGPSVRPAVCPSDLLPPSRPGARRTPPAAPSRAPRWRPRVNH